jgi:hypothetical protein
LDHPGGSPFRANNELPFAAVFFCAGASCVSALLRLLTRTRRTEIVRRAVPKVTVRIVTRRDAPSGQPLRSLAEPAKSTLLDHNLSSPVTNNHWLIDQDNLFDELGAFIRLIRSFSFVPSWLIAFELATTNKSA